MLSPDLLYQIALTKVPNIGYYHARLLLQQFGNAQSIFKCKQHELEKIEGIGTVRAKSIKSFHDFSFAEEEIKFIEKYKIKTFSLIDEDYPKRLLNCYDPPTIVFYKGNANLNAEKVIAVIGTRSNTDYGKQVTENLIKDLTAENVLVVSGLAFGVDAIAHKTAVKNNMATVGVLAHGLDQVYPSQHNGLAKEMIQGNGGLLTEFCSNTKPDKHNFPTRNRIVAGMSDAVIVVESGIKGGSMVTAELANGYNKDVFAFPGKVTDGKSEGCNYLIKTNKAMLLTNAQELQEVMGWQQTEQPKKKVQKELFIDLTKDERLIVDILKEKDLVHIDEINFKSSLSSSAIAAAILSLELQNVVGSQPGKMYKLI